MGDEPTNTIYEMLAAKCLLESQITSAIETFEAETGLAICGISIEKPASLISPRKSYVSIDARLMVDIDNNLITRPI